MLTPPDGASTHGLFQALFANSGDAIALVDAGGIVQFATPSSERILGYSVAERAGHSSFDLVHPDDLAKAREAFADSLTQPAVPIATEFRMRHKDGSWRNVEIIGSNRLDDPTVGAIIVNYRDVTERRRAEQALRASEQRLRSLVEHAQDLIYYCDLNGRFTYVNPTAARVMRYEERELLGRHFITLIRPDHRAAAGDLYTRQMAERIPNTYLEFAAITKDGETIWVGQHVQLVSHGDDLVGVQAIARDITRQKDAEEALRRSEARYRSLIQGAAYGIFRSTPSGEILDANPALAAMLGYATVNELLTRDMYDVFRVREERDRFVAAHGPSHEPVSAEVAWQRKDGTPITVWLTARAVSVEDGATWFEGIAEDITARRALEEQLRQAQKMEAVGRLARGVAHDFNNVLAAIVGCSDLLLTRLKPGNPAREEADEIRKAAERGAALTRQLVAFSRRQVQQPQVLDVHAVVREFESMLQRLTLGLIELRLHTPGDPPLARMEPGQIEQIVLNLVVNARDAVAEHGRVDVTADCVVLDETNAGDFPGMPHGPYARIAVRDTGSGISPEVQRHVFEPFFSTKDASKGSGLGLSIVYGIAKEAGGTVTFSTSSEGPDHGTTFEVLLPLIPPA